MNKENLGFNFLTTAYWNNVPTCLDLCNGTEPPFYLPRKADGSDDWNNCEVVQTEGRKFTKQGRVRTTVLMKTERLYSTGIAVLHRGLGTVIGSYSHTKKLNQIEIPIHGIQTHVSFFNHPTGGQFTFDVIDAENFELVAIVEQEYFGNWLNGEILHPVIQAIGATLPGIRRLMDICGVDCDDTVLPTTKPFTYHGIKYLPGFSRNGKNSLDLLLLLPDLIKKHPGKYQISIPTFLDDANVIELGRRFKGIANLHVGFSNELWNTAPGFEYSARFMAMRPAGMERAEWYLRESIRKIILFEQGYEAKTIRIAEWQASDNWAFGRDPWKNNLPSIPFIHENLSFFDMVGIAPYLFNDSRPVTQEEYNQHILVLKSRCSWWKAVANEHNIKLFGYEGLIEIPGEHNKLVRDSEVMRTYIKNYLSALMPYFDDFCVYTGAGDVWGLIEGNGTSIQRALGVLDWIQTTYMNLSMNPLALYMKI